MTFFSYVWNVSGVENDNRYAILWLVWTNWCAIFDLNFSSRPVTVKFPNATWETHTHKNCTIAFLSSLSNTREKKATTNSIEKRVCIQKLHDRLKRKFSSTILYRRPKTVYLAEIFGMYKVKANAIIVFGVDHTPPRFHNCTSVFFSWASVFQFRRQKSILQRDGNLDNGYISFSAWFSLDRLFNASKWDNNHQAIHVRWHRVTMIYGI